MSNPDKCLLLLNVGTPDSPEAKDVRSYLSQFLNDKRVIDLPWLARKILVNGIIVPFRVSTSVKIYTQLWENHGRILDTLTASLTEKLQKHFGNKLAVKYAMRYGNPSIDKAMEEIKAEGYKELILFPLFPQNAMSTTETSEVEAYRLITKYGLQLKTRSIAAFYQHPKFIEGVVAQAANYDWKNYDYVLFSYHGLPNRHIKKAHKSINYNEENIECCNCEVGFNDSYSGCYKAECYETSRLIAQQMGIPKDKYTVAFQSRLSKNWLKPFSDKTVANLAKKGKKKLLAFTPSFAIDCLETLNEIGEEYAEDFYNAGGQQLDLVPCLNDSEAMVTLTEALITEVVL